jgi:hypothetical protein
MFVKLLCGNDVMSAARSTRRVAGGMRVASSGARPSALPNKRNPAMANSTVNDRTENYRERFG